MERLAGAGRRVCIPHRHTVKPPDDARSRALERLYARRVVVKNLIDALERYQREVARQRALSAVITDGKMS